MREKKKEAYEPLNYAAAAINDIKSFFLPLFHSKRMAISIANAELILDMLEKSVKFILPNKGVMLNGELDPTKIKQEWLDLTILPFPVCVFEIPFLDDGVLEYNLVKSSKRIALAWDIQSTNESVQALNNSLKMLEADRYNSLILQGGVAILTLSYIDDLKKWTLCSKAVLLEKGLEISEESGFRGTFLDIFPEYAVLQGSYLGDMEQVGKDVIADSTLEVLSVIQACCMLNCENVKVKNLSAPAAIVKNRIKKKLPALHEYKVLDIFTQSSESEQVHTDGGSKGGHKRMHFRRGHIRRYSNGKFVFVRSAVIGQGVAKSIGAVDKSYRIVI